MVFHGRKQKTAHHTVYISLSLSVYTFFASTFLPLTLSLSLPPVRLQIDQGTLGVPDRKYLLKGTNDTVVKAYLETMVDIAIALGAKDKDQVEKEMKQVLNFEIQLANVSYHHQTTLSMIH